MGERIEKENGVQHLEPENGDKQTLPERRGLIFTICCLQCQRCRGCCLTSSKISPEVSPPTLHHSSLLLSSPLLTSFLNLSGLIERSVDRICWFILRVFRNMLRRDWRLWRKL